MTPSSDPTRTQLLTLYRAAVEAVHGRACVARYLRAHALKGDVYVIAVGKAAVAMSEGALQVLGEQIQDALIVTKHGHSASLPWPVMTAGHPVPDDASLAAGAALLRTIQSLPSSATVLCLISGGASALIEVLPAALDLAQWQQVNNWLLASGVDILACNRVRKRLSCIKGGRLASYLAPRAVLGLCLSDVPGNDLGAIGSGLLSPVTAAEAALALPSGLPISATQVAQLPPMPLASHPCFANIRLACVADLEQAKQAAAVAASALGYDVELVATPLAGPSAQCGRDLAATLLQAPAGRLFVWGGETSVVLPAHPGRGGRCQHLALAAAAELAGHAGHYLLAAGTDGSDGPGEDAGALIDAATLARGQAQGHDWQQALSAADAGSFLAASGDLVHTGPTGTNVMDLVLGLKQDL